MISKARPRAGVKPSDTFNRQFDRVTPPRTMSWSYPSPAVVPFSSTLKELDELNTMLLQTKIPGLAPGLMLPPGPTLTLPTLPLLPPRVPPLTTNGLELSVPLTSNVPELIATLVPEELPLVVLSVSVPDPILVRVAPLPLKAPPKVLDKSFAPLVRPP